jgi:putative SOS response-associated peptidase YedK
MCARFTLKSSAIVLQDLFELDEVPELVPRYNIAPSQIIPAIVAPEGHREMRFFQWGLVPSWAKDPSIAPNLINAKSETAPEKPSFRAAFKRRRCLIPADGFYEWTTVEPSESDLFGESTKAEKPYKQPYLFSMKGGELFALGGLYEYWEGVDAGPIESCTILTTEPNKLVAFFHNRMPVIIAPEDYALWLDPEPKPPEMLLALAGPFPSDRMKAHPVSRAMSNPRFEDPSCIEPIAV